MSSPEDVARRAADAAVAVVPLNGEYTLRFGGKSPPPRYYQHAEHAENEARAWRNELEPLFLAALREMLAPPAPGGIDAARLAEIRRRDALVMPAEDAPSLFGYQPESRDAFRDRRALLAAYDHVAGVLRAIGDGELAAYCAGHDEGKRAGEATARDRAVFLTRALQKIATYEAAHCVDPTASAAWEIATEALEAADAPPADPEAPAG